MKIDGTPRLSATARERIARINHETAQQALGVIKEIYKSLTSISGNEESVDNQTTEAGGGDVSRVNVSDEEMGFDDTVDVVGPAGDDGLSSDDDERAEQQNDDGAKAKARDAVHKGLPMGRVKQIIKTDPDVNMVAGDAVFAVTKATESFVGLLALHCYKEMEHSNKKTLQKKHIDAVIENKEPFKFLEGALDW